MLKQHNNYPNKFQQYGGLVVLPNTGKLYIASDFHARYTDFNKWLSKTGVVDDIQDDKDIYVFLNGDIVDIKPDDKFAQKNGDTKIIKKIREIQSFENGNRFIYGLGNHEDETIRTYAELTQFLTRNYFSDDINSIKSMIFLNKSDNHIKNFNFIKRIDSVIANYLEQLPIAILTKNGLVATHAGPSQSLNSPENIMAKELGVIQEITWGRPNAPDVNGKIYAGDYTNQDISDFLRQMNNSKVLVSGHTPVNLIHPDFLYDGFDVACIGDQIIHSTSYGSVEPDTGTHIEVDLSKPITSVSDLIPNTNLVNIKYNR
ncbi:hypothetical protein GQ473_01075 [archaeon]|nr:hypothetical protein [archaeon]